MPILSCNSTSSFPIRRTRPHRLILRAVCGEQFPQLFPIRTQILGVLPSQHNALSPARCSERHIPASFTSLPLRCTVPCLACSLELPGKRRSTHRTRRIIFVEGRDQDRLSHNSLHHQYFTASREPNKSLYLYR